MEYLLCFSGIAIIGVVGLAIHMNIRDCPSRIVNARGICFRERMRLVVRWGQHE